MSENPFGAMGGGFDMNALLEQAQQMQDQLAQAQASLAEARIAGTVAGGAVSVEVTGLGELTGVQIKAGEFDGNDADALTDLGDLVVAAYRDAKAKADAQASQAMGPLAEGGAGGGFPGLG